MKKRKTQAIVAMILITVLLTGCGQGASSKPPAQAQTQEQTADAEGQKETWRDLSRFARWWRISAGFLLWRNSPRS